MQQGPPRPRLRRALHARRQNVRVGRRRWHHQDMEVRRRRGRLRASSHARGRRRLISLASERAPAQRDRVVTLSQPARPRRAASWALRRARPLQCELRCARSRLRRTAVARARCGGTARVYTRHESCEVTCHRRIYTVSLVRLRVGAEPCGGLGAGSWVAQIPQTIRIWTKM